ncbi:MAG: phenylacetate--CoA ligase family protein [Gammaproteobacteria bacterium]|nr:phenylacetate--CoA ligase family protein [Gammaproteobacteria bacterium]
MLTWLSRHVFFPLWEIKDGAHRQQYLRELSETQWLDAQTLRQKQWDRVRAAVKYAFDHCPYYYKRFADAGLDGPLHEWADFRRLPLLSKQDIRTNGESLLSREFRREDLIEARTGGSTGTALTLFCDKTCQEIRNAAAMRSDQWAGWDIGMKVAAVWGNPPVADTLKKQLRSLLLDRIMYLDTMEINETTVRRFVDKWRRERPRVMFGHSHSIYILATYLKRMSIEDLRPHGIIATSMMLLEPERRLIEDVFHCKATDRYGCEEVSLIGCECEQHNGLHLNVDHIVVEFLREDGTEANSAEEAHIVVTDLINRGMPLIRYRVEDMGVPSNRVCPCGRGLPLMERVTGRRADFLKRPDGSLVAGVSLVERTLTAIPGIEQMQLVQDELHRVCAKVVKDNHFSEGSERRLRNELQTVFGDEVTIELQYSSDLDQTSSGKYRFAICNV